MSLDAAGLLRSLDEQLAQAAPRLTVQRRWLLFVEVRGMLAALRAIGEIAPQDQADRQARWAATLGVPDRGGDGGHEDVVGAVVQISASDLLGQSGGGASVSQMVTGTTAPAGSRAQGAIRPPAAHRQQPPVPATPTAGTLATFDPEPDQTLFPDPHPGWMQVERVEIYRSGVIICWRRTATPPSTPAGFPMPEFPPFLRDVWDTAYSGHATLLDAHGRGRTLYSPAPPARIVSVEVTLPHPLSPLLVTLRGILDEQAS